MTRYSLLEKGISDEVVSIVELLTKEDTLAKEYYYNCMGSNPKAMLIKAADRCHNVSTMSSFKPARLQKYINETYNDIIPLIREARQKYPQYEDTFFSFKYQIMSLCELAEEILKQSNEKC